MFYEKARKDLDVARYQLARSQDDEYYFDIVSYHIQQSIEKSLKTLISNRGFPFTLTHNIGLLLRELKTCYETELASDTKFASLVTELEDSATLYTSWESSSRYDENFIETRRNIEKGIDHAQRLIEECRKQSVGSQP